MKLVELRPGVTLSGIIFLQCMYWLPWALLTPVIFYLARRFPLKKKRAFRHVALHLGVSLALGGLFQVYAIMAELLLMPEPNRPFSPGLAIQLLGSQNIGHLLPPVAVYWLVLAIAIGIAFFRHNREREALLARARLQALRARVHPHFLFNSLHAVSAMMEDDVKGARRMIACLSDLLRESLAGEAHQTLPLAEEIMLLRLYFKIEHVRFADRLVVNWRLQECALNAQVPQLLLQPLAENAVRHGISRRLESGCIEIGATVENGRLRLYIEDDGPGLESGPLNNAKGLGLDITRERLRHMYGEDARLILGDRPSGGCVATIHMPFHPAGDSRSNSDLSGLGN